LRGGSRARSPLAKIDFLKALPGRRWIEIEQRTLRQRKPDRAFDVTGHQIITALEPLVETFENATRLIASFTGAFDRHLIAARIGNYAEPPLDQREILTVLAKQCRSEPIVVKRKNDLCRVVGRDENRFLRFGRAHSDSCCDQGRHGGGRPKVCSGGIRKRAEQAVAADLGNRYRRYFADQGLRRVGLHQLKIGRAADQLARMAAVSFKQYVEGASQAAAIELRLALINRMLQALQPV